MPFPCTIQALPPIFCGDFPIAAKVVFPKRDMPPDVQGEARAGADYFSQVDAPALAVSTRAILWPALIHVSDDSTLARSRDPLLRAAGFVTTTLTGRQFEAYQLFGDVSAVFLCQTIDAERAFLFCRRPSSRAGRVCTIRLSSDPSAEHTSFNHLFQSPIHPIVFAREMLGIRVSITNEADAVNDRRRHWQRVSCRGESNGSVPRGTTA